MHVAERFEDRRGAEHEIHDEARVNGGELVLDEAIVQVPGGLLDHLHAGFRGGG